MSTIETINKVADAVISVLNSNRVAIGNPEYVYEKIENPAIINEDHMLPTVHVIPLAEGTDSITTTVGDVHHHEFAITIIGTYDVDDVNLSLREVREYGYNCVDLFRGPGTVLGPGHVYKSVLKFGVYIVATRILQQYYITLYVKAFDED